MVVVLLLKLVVYEVNESQVAVVLTLGRATSETSESGASLKWPDPIQRVRHFDARQRVLKGPFEESLTRDGRSLLVGSFLIWRITSAQEFLNQVGDTSAAERHLRDLLRSAQSAEIAQGSLR